jgi:hypothetical protein
LQERRAGWVSHCFAAGRAAGQTGHVPGHRDMNHHLLDLGLTKNVAVSKRVRVQIRIEALNATNYTLFGSGNMTMTPNNATFMKLNNIDSSTVMKPRDIQIGARVTF